MNAVAAAKKSQLEILRNTLWMEIERSAPESNTFGSVLFINSSVYLRTPHGEGAVTRNSQIRAFIA